MGFFRDIRVGNIYIIVRKNMPDGFSFRNPSRELSGFVLYLSGNGEYVDSSGASHATSAGSFIPLNRCDSYTFKFDGACSYITTAFDLEIASPEFGAALPPVYQCSGSEIGELTELCRLWNGRDRDSPTVCRIMLEQFYLNLFRSLESNDVGAADISCRACEYVVRNYNRNFTIGDAADYCRVSPSYLRRKFRETFGATIPEYRERLRVQKAKELLRSGEFHIKEIALMLGYSDVYHFAKNFKKSANTTPGRYKNTPTPP